jgi:hypothetical protein
MALLGCGGSPTAVSEGVASNTPSAATASGSQNAQQSSGPAAAATKTNIAEKDDAPTKASSSAAAAQPAVDDVVRKPATVSEAAAVLDLSTFPLLPGVKDPGARVVAELSYQADSENVKTAFEFQKRHLLERQWKELSEPQFFDQSASGEFGRDGYRLSVSVFAPGEAGKVNVHIQNHGNVNLRKLPAPPGAKLQYAFPAVASFVTEAAVDQTAEAVRKLLLADGWQPYGSAGDTMQFKQNAVQLDARVVAPPAQPGKTFIDYSTAQLSADLPAPPDAARVDYADSIKQLNVEAMGTPENVAAFYKGALGPAGWQPTSDNPIKDRFESFMIFRNPAKDMLTLTMRELEEQKMTRVTLKHQSAAEVEEIDRQIRLAMDERKKREAEERNRPKPKAAITLPADASDVQATPQEIEFQLGTGKAKAALDALSSQLQAAGWKAEEPVGQKEAGQLRFTKDSHSISVLYVDPGFIPAQITITASGVELERAGADKK